MDKYRVSELMEDTLIHIKDVQNVLEDVREKLLNRLKVHDVNKMYQKDCQVLCDALNGKTDWVEWNKLHMEVYDHHLEYYDGDITKISLPALMEMVADGASACYRRNGVEKCTYEDQYAFYIRKGFNEQLASLLANEFMRSIEIIKSH